MISHEKKFYFVHISKTGGNSIQSALEKYSYDDIVYFNNKFGENQDIKVLNKEAGINYEAGRNYKHTSATWFMCVFPKYADYFKFTCIRNPWDRSISRYFWQFNKFDKKKFISNIINSSEYLPQKNQYEGCDFIMKYENIQEDFDIVCDKLDIERIELPVLNKSIRGTYQQYYDDETIKMVYNKFKLDIDDFGYEFEYL